MSDLTPRQRQILRFIEQCVSESGMPPTRAEIAGALGFRSANAAEEHLRALQRKGAIDLVPGASRGIVLKDVLREQMGLPLVGRVAAGRPILAEEHIEARYQIDPDLFTSSLNSGATPPKIDLPDVFICPSLCSRGWGSAAGSPSHFYGDTV